MDAPNDKKLPNNDDIKDAAFFAGPEITFPTAVTLFSHENKNKKEDEADLLNKKNTPVLKK